MTRVLVIDDEAPIRLLCRVNLEAEGMGVLEASDGPSGLEKARHELPDVVLLDVMMPGLDGWGVAEADGAIAGAALAFGSRDFGWVLDLGVRRPWRGRGLGHALLLGVFGKLYRRGFTRVGLEVDAASETGATRLYERAGMRVTRRYDWYERRL